MKEGLLNTAFWANNPPFHDAAHKSGVLSLIWFALFIPLIGKRLVSEGIRIFHSGPRPFRVMPCVIMPSNLSTRTRASG
jgi:hypothetical protein